ncbi:MAG: tetratricopeptide repeat protein [Oscillospiraceae bacterium]|nr:tetratricopeptide repeat protein [Oscillospiraceae bacterium]
MKRILIFAVAACLVVSLCACGAKKEEETPTYEDYVSTGSTALDDKDYEKAQENFADAVTLDSKQTEAYFGLYEAYMGLEDVESAEQALSDGIAETGNEDMKRILDNLKDPDASSGATEDDWSGESSSSESSSGETSSGETSTGK